MKLDLRPLISEDIRVLPVRFSLSPAGDSESTETYDVCYTSPLDVAGEITNTAGYMRMTVEASISYHVPCARCLKDVPGTFSFRLEKTVAPAGLLNDLHEEDADDYVIVEDGYLDIDALLLETLELEFPSKILCRADCRGLCATCGKDLNDGPCTCQADTQDPRLAPLEALLARMRGEKAEKER